MAAIGSIRKHSTILLVVVALALLSFLLGDLNKNNRSNKIYDKFISIGNENISYNMYMNKYEQYREMQKKDGRSLEPNEDFQLGLQVYDELVDSIIFARQAGYLGISITPEELHDLVAGPNPHPMALQFFARGDLTNYNMAGVQHFIENLSDYAQSDDSVFVNYYLTVLEPMIEREAFKSKYLNLLSGAYYLPKAFAQKISDEAHLRADLEVIQIPYSSELVSDDKISFTEEEVKKCYEENKYRYKQEDEFRNVEYVIFNIEPTEEDLKNIEDNVAHMFEEFTQAERADYFVNRLVDSRFDSTYYKRGMLEPAIDTLLFDAKEGTFIAPYIDRDYWVFAKLLSAQMRPDSINISSLVIANYGMQDNPRKKTESEKIVDSAYMMAKSGVDFYQVAQQYSDLPVSEDLEQFNEWIEDGSNIQIFYDSLYKLPIGSIVKYELPNITYIFRLNEKTAAERKIQVAIGRKQILASSETVGNLESAANNFVNGTDTYQKFVDAVTANNLNKRSNDRVMKMNYSLPGIREGGREIIRWIFDENTKKGTVSNVFYLEDMYVVVVLKDIYPEGYTSLDNEMVKNQIEAMVKRDKRAEILEEVFKKQIAHNKTLQAISEYNDIALNTLTVSFADRNFGYYGPEPKMIGKIFGKASVGQIEIWKGDMGVYAIKINKFDMPSPETTPANDDNLSMIAQQYKMVYQNRITSGGTQILRKMYKIKDNRDKVM